jgi:hypothetical protein
MAPGVNLKVNRFVVSVILAAHRLNKINVRSDSYVRPAQCAVDGLHMKDSQMHDAASNVKTSAYEPISAPISIPSDRR